MPSLQSESRIQSACTLMQKVPAECNLEVRRQLKGREKKGRDADLELRHKSGSVRRDISGILRVSGIQRGKPFWEWFINTRNKK